MGPQEELNKRCCWVALGGGRGRKADEVARLLRDAGRRLLTQVEHPTSLLGAAIDGVIMRIVVGWTRRNV